MAFSKVSVDEEEYHEDLTSCSICLSIIEEPKALPCLHTYCLKCLCEWAKPGRTTVNCPMCRKIFTLPVGGAAGLQNNFFVTKLKDRQAVRKKLANKKCVIPCSSCGVSGQAAVARCVECDDFLCENCLKPHTTVRSLRSHHTFTLEELRSGKSDPVEKVEYCSKHKGQILWIFCKTCGIVICRDCTVFDHCKPEHDFVDLETATKDHRDTIDLLAKECKKLTMEVDSAIKDDDQATGRLETSMNNALTELSKSYERAKSSILARLEANYNTLSAEIKQTSATGRKDIETHTDELHILRSRLRTSLETASQLTQTGSDYDVAQMYASLTASLQELRDVKHPPVQKGRVEEVTFKCSSDNDQPMVLGSVDSVIEQPEVVESVSPDIKAKSNKGRSWKFERELECDKVNNFVCNVTANESNGEICFVDYSYNTYVMDNNGQFKCLPKKGRYPFGVTINAKGEYFTTGDDGFVYKFLPSVTEQAGGKFSIVPPNGAGRYQAVGITMDRKQHIVVGESHNKCISIHTENGIRIKDFKVNVHPNYIAINSHNQIAVSCYGCCSKVEVIDMTQSGRLLFTVNAPADVKSWMPCGVCWNKDDDLFVVDRQNGGIHQFSPTGDYKGCVIKGLVNPRCLTIDNDKMLVGYGKCIKEYRYK